MKVAIIGYGVVGQATHKTIQKNNEVMIHDPDKGKHCVYQEADVVFICTPETPVYNYIQKLTNHPYVYIRSTIPFTWIKDTNIAIYPEFLTERYADYDALYPKTSIVGGTPEQFNMLNKVSIHSNFNYTTPEYAMLAKLSTNVYFISKVTMANVFYNLCKKYGLDYDKLKNTMAADERVYPNEHWSVPGHDGKLGWGGKCFPMSIKMMKSLVDEKDYNLLDEFVKYNETQRLLEVDKLRQKGII